MKIKKSDRFRNKLTMPYWNLSNQLRFFIETCWGFFIETSRDLLLKPVEIFYWNQLRFFIETCWGFLLKPVEIFYWNLLRFFYWNLLRLSISDPPPRNRGATVRVWKGLYITRKILLTKIRLKLQIFAFFYKRGIAKYLQVSIILKWHSVSKVAKNFV